MGCSPDSWDGEDINKVYVIDPITRKQKELEIKTPNRIFDFIDKRSLDKNHFKDSIEKMIQDFQLKQVHKRISEIVNNSINNHVSKDSVFTQEIIDNIVEEVSLEFVKFILRIPSSEEINLKK